MGVAVFAFLRGGSASGIRTLHVWRWPNTVGTSYLNEFRMRGAGKGYVARRWRHQAPPNHHHHPTYEANSWPRVPLSSTRFEAHSTDKPSSSSAALNRSRRAAEVDHS